MPIRPPLRASGLIAFILLPALAQPAFAESSPYYLGASQTLGYESNLYRIGGTRTLPAGAKSKSDTVASSAVFAGVDQTWGRQRLSGSATLRADRYADNSHLDNNGYGLKLALDWATVDRIAGRLAVQSDRSLRNYDPVYQSGQPAERNIEDNNLVQASVRIGVVTRMTGEATLSRRQVRFTAQAFAQSQYDQDIGSVGLRYRPSSALALGMTLREGRTTRPSLNDPSTRRDVDLSATWDPSALTSGFARISYTQSDHSNAAQRNFSGVTAELRGSTQVTGKLRLNAKFSRELGLSYSLFDFAGLTSATEFDRVGTMFRLGADQELTGKIALNAAVEYQRRNFAGTRFTILSGDDSTTTVELGVRWNATRAIQAGCNLSQASRSVHVIGNPYSSTSANCYGQFTLQ